MSLIEADNVIIDTVSHLLSRECNRDVVQAAEDGNFPVAMWTALCDSAVPWAWIPEESGGVGGSLADGAAIIHLAAQYAAPVPLCETLIAGRILADAGISVPMTSMSLVPLQSGRHLSIDKTGRMSGRACRIPYARHVEELVAVAMRDSEPVITRVRRDDCAVTLDRSMAGEPLDDVDFGGARGLDMTPVHPKFIESAWQLGALAKALQICGAMQKVLALTVEYAKERKQFGRAIAKFQVIQHMIATQAEEVAAAACITDKALSISIAEGPVSDASAISIAAAKVRCSEAATEVARIAHQVHGAIGFAREYELHQFTRRMWSWCDDFGSETTWAVEVGRRVSKLGGAALWSAVTDLS